MPLSAKYTIAAISIALSGHTSWQPAVSYTVQAVQQWVHTHLSSPHHTNPTLNDQAQKDAKKQREREQSLKLFQDIQRNNEVLRLQWEKMQKEREIQRLRSEKERLEWEARQKWWDNNRSTWYKNNIIGSPIYTPQHTPHLPTWKPIGLLMKDSTTVQGAVIVELKDPIAIGNTFAIWDIIYNINNIPMANAYDVAQYLRDIPRNGRTSFFVKRGDSLLEISWQNNMFYR